MAVLPAVGGVQTVLVFQLTGNLPAPAEVVTVADASAIGIHADGHNMQVVAVDVLMLVDNKRLLTESHPFHILTRDVFQLHVRQAVVRMRIERHVHDGLLRPRVRGKVTGEVLHGTADVHLSGTAVENLVRAEQLALLLVDFLPVVRQRPEQRFS